MRRSAGNSTFPVPGYLHGDLRLKAFPSPLTDGEDEALAVCQDGGDEALAVCQDGGDEALAVCHLQ